MGRTRAGSQVSRSPSARTSYVSGSTSIRGTASVFHYGIDPAGRELSAHVWVSLGERIMIGEDEAGRHARVASFPEDVG